MNRINFGMEMVYIRNTDMAVMKLLVMSNSNSDMAAYRL